MAARVMQQSARNFVARRGRALERFSLKELRSSSRAKPTTMLERACRAERLLLQRDRRLRGVAMFLQGTPCCTAQRRGNSSSQAERENGLRYATAVRSPWWKALANTDANT